MTKCLGEYKKFPDFLWLDVGQEAGVAVTAIQPNLTHPLSGLMLRNKNDKTFWSPARQ